MAKVGGALKAKCARRGPAEDKIAILQPRDEDAEAEAKQERVAEEESGCASKKVVFAVLPDKYEPLGRAGERQEALGAERKSGRRKRKLKKYGKILATAGRVALLLELLRRAPILLLGFHFGMNVGKVLQKGCRYLVLGLQGLANAYSSPFGVAVSVAAAFR